MRRSQILTIDTIAQLAAGYSILKTFAVLFLAVATSAVTAQILFDLSEVESLVLIFAGLTGAAVPACFAPSKALAVFGLAI